jgi:hypothetical protein
VTLPASRVVLYVREACHLCDEFLLDLSVDLGPDWTGVELRDVDQVEALAARYGLRVPVLEVGGVVACEGRYDSARVRRALGV